MKLEILHESTSFLRYLISKLPNTPRYVIKDLIYQAMSPAGKGKERHWTWDDINLGWPDIGPLDQLIWTPKPILMTFNLEMFTEETQGSLKQRAGGASPQGFTVPRDADRHQTQAQRLGTSELAFQEPVIMIKHSNGEFELFEGWHRTIQAFSKFGEGFKGMAYVARKP